MTMRRLALGRHSGARSASFEAYRPLVDRELLDEVTELARSLRDLRICHLNSTSNGGGVAEILGREIPLLQALGIEAEWQILPGDDEFFAVTKGLHNGLHGGRFEVTPEASALYLRQNEAAAATLTDEYDVYVVHDPQPAALCRFRRRTGERWIWRSHVDSSTPDVGVWGFLRPFVEEYDAAVFTMKEFVPADLRIPRLQTIPPAIDPLSTRNMDIPSEFSRRVMSDLGIDLARPVVTQISRFDPWKDPLGVIEAYRLARQEIRGLQLVLAGALADDDPEGRTVLEQVEDVAAADPDIFIFTNLGNLEVNVFQRSADVVVQKSLREGFGLVISETLWKRRPMVAGDAGGIPMQVPAPYHGFLVDSVEDCAEKLTELLRDADLRRAYGEAGHQHVRSHFLLPHLVRDDLRLIAEVLREQPTTASGRG
jgi:trehalose synthase